MNADSSAEAPRLIVVEDDRAFAETLALELSEHGYQVRCADSLAILEEGMETFHADLALVDLRLGRDSGLTAVSRLRERFPGSRIIVLTGYGSISTAVEAMKRGADDYLTKPVAIDRLLCSLAGETGGGNEAEAADVETLARHERDFVESVLLQCGGNVSAAARRLGIHRQSLQRKLRKFAN